MADPSSKKWESEQCFQVDDYMEEGESHLNTSASPCHDGSRYFYSEPISLPSPGKGRTPFPPSDVVEISAVITFNLGLALYKVSQENEIIKTKTKALNQSLTLFEKAKLICQSRESNSSSIPLFLMAILNNMGVLLQLLGHNETSQQLFERLMVFWLYFCASNLELLQQHQHRQSSKSRILLDGFLLNVLPGHSFAAGAA
jgi:hypothetical protein